MSKITRRSYKRKKIIMGAGLFGAIGLVSTGFAAWVLSAPAETSKNQNLSVGVVSDKNMEFTTPIIYKTGDANKVEDATFHFNPKENDTTGRVRWGAENENDKPESLSLTVETTLTNVQNLGEIKGLITLKTEAHDGDFNKACGIGEGSKEYVVAPALYNAETVLWNKDDEDVGAGFHSSVNTETNVMTMTYKVEFAWGEFFNEMNPSEYFDTAAGKAAYPEIGEGNSTNLTEVAGILNDLHALLDNVELTLTLTANPF